MDIKTYKVLELLMQHSSTDSQGYVQYFFCDRRQEFN